MIRSYKGMRPTIPATCYVDDSAQIIGDVVLGEHASVWMNAVVRGRRARDPHRRALQRAGQQRAARHEAAVGRISGRVRHGRAFGDAARLRDRRPLPDRHGIDHFEWREDWGRIDHRRRNADSGETVVEPGSLWMGSPGKFRRKLETADEEAIMRYARNYLGYKDEYLKRRGVVAESASGSA